MAESKGLENALAAILAKMETMSEEMKASREEMIADMQRISEESKARDEEMIAIRQKFWEEMDADREERMAKLQEMSADIEVDLSVENIVPCDNFEVPNVLVEHTLNESNMEVNQDVTFEGLTENGSVVDEIESDYTETTLLGPSSSYLGKVEYLDSASDCSEDNRNEISSNNTISLEHTSGKCCDEVIVYRVTDIACENRERIVEFEADSVCTVSYTHLDVYKRQQYLYVNGRLLNKQSEFSVLTHAFGILSVCLSIWGMSDDNF